MYDDKTESTNKLRENGYNITTSYYITFIIFDVAIASVIILTDSSTATK